MSNLMMKIDDVIDEWARGKLTNTQLRSGIKSLGAEVLNPRITSGMASNDLEIALPSGKVKTGFNAGGVAKGKKKKPATKRGMAIVISVGAVPIKKKTSPKKKKPVRRKKK
mgnify:CR=1 FL=1|tara:strand:+ start:79 stop:411 length:333 start_codon:yes stop_codon:yes gene_type:complete